MATLISGTDLRTLGLDASFQDLYERSTEDIDSDIESLYREVEAKTNQVQFGALFDVPSPEAWTDGSAMPEASIDSLTHTITVLKYAVKLPWRVDDEEDDQIGAIQDRVGELATEFADLPPTAAVDLITASASLLPSIPTCYDGSALYIASTRFGNAGGNSVTGGGVGTPGAIQTDFYNGKSRLKSFVRHTDTSKPFWASRKIDDNTQYMLVFSSAASVEQNARAAFGQQISLDVTGVAGVTNILAANQPRLKFWSRLSGDDWRMFFTGSETRKPFLMAKRHAAPVQVEFNDSGSDWARDYDRKAVGWKQRIAFGYASPETTVLIDN